MGKTGGFRARRTVVRALGMFAIVGVLASGLAFSSPTPAAASGEGTILSLVNNARAAEGLGPLKLDSSLSSVSSAWAKKMAANGVMAHNPNYSSQIKSGWTRAAENVARGWTSPTAVHDAWMDSSGHRANIMGDYTHIGISFLTINGTTWAVQNFAKYGKSVPAPAVTPSGVERLSGADRYSTAVAISQEYKPGVDVIYVATGDNYPDALSAAPAAAMQGGPLLLTPPTGLPTVVKNEIKRLKPALIVVVGGEGVLSKSIYSQLSKLAPKIRRDGGASRYETSRIVVQRAFPQGADTAFFATGANYPDALSASAAAGSTESPVILIDGKANGVDSATAKLIDRLDVSDIMIAGGTGVVSSKVMKALDAQPGIDSTTRYSGSDRYATSQAINDASFDTAPRAFFAVGTGYADALAGAALAGNTSAPLYVVPGNCVPKSVVGNLKDFDTSNRVLLGGTGALGNGVAKMTPCS
ncbi:cell wall-binding repeat-containing protein [Salinibacterium sp. SWN1162]|uniref:cell wall-binding repeat-containing protein n=1 Tax=Salinibacterium sp. SWN1162 TaxID=2792053 RepID=UPI0018CF51CB|nr:cell wall-binding repeat-containing protein [Salinibacterium sp. SWN1162]MBH0008361.1 cell wall-binding repeat-containing protein [Salinibacterium sp. SWN1162]